MPDTQEVPTEGGLCPLLLKGHWMIRKKEVGGMGKRRSVAVIWHPLPLPTSVNDKGPAGFWL